MSKIISVKYVKRETGWFEVIRIEENGKYRFVEMLIRGN